MIKEWLRLLKLLKQLVLIDMIRYGKSQLFPLGYEPIRQIFTM